MALKSLNPQQCPFYQKINKVTFITEFNYLQIMQNMIPQSLLINWRENMKQSLQAKKSDQKKQQLPQQPQIRYKSFPMLVFMVINYCLGFFYFGYNLVYLGTFRLENIVIIFDINIDENVAFGLLMGCLPIGAAIGSLFSALLMKIFSRKNSLLFINTLAIIIVGVSLIPNFGLLFFCRFMQGLFVGFYTAHISLIIKQITPYETSGTFGAFSQLFVNIGVFVGFLIQFLITEFSSQQQLWRLVFGFMVIPIVIQTILLIFVFNFETPKYLLQEEREEDCIQLLKKIYKQQFVNQVFEEKKKDLGEFFYKKQSEKQKQKQSQQNQMSSSKSLSMLVKQQMQNPERQVQQKKVKPLEPIEHKKCIRQLLSIQLSVLQQFCGIQAFSAYGVFIIMKVLPDYANLIPMVFSIVPIVAGLITAGLLVKFGRKVILHLGTIFTVIALILTQVGFSIENESSESEASKYLIVIGYFIFMMMFGLSIGPLVFLYVAQIVDPEFVSVASLANWGTAAIVSILFPILTGIMETPGPIFIFFAVWCFCSLILNQKLMIETKGKTQKQIYEEYDQKY